MTLNRGTSSKDASSQRPRETLPFPLKAQPKLTIANMCYFRMKYVFIMLSTHCKTYKAKKCSMILNSDLEVTVARGVCIMIPSKGVMTWSSVANR